MLLPSETVAESVEAVEGVPLVVVLLLEDIKDGFDLSLKNATDGRVVRVVMENSLTAP